MRPKAGAGTGRWHKHGAARAMLPARCDAELRVGRQFRFAKWRREHHRIEGQAAARREQQMGGRRASHADMREIKVSYGRTVAHFAPGERSERLQRAGDWKGGEG